MGGEERAEAARLARLAGRPAEAAELYASAGDFYQAALCQRQAGQAGKAIHSLIRVPAADSRYRDGCRVAIELAAELGLVSLELENFLAPFIRSGPRGDDEVAAFQRLAVLYRDEGYSENAREAAAKLLEVQPDHAAAAELLRQLSAGAAPAPVELPELPELPMLPPPMPPRAPSAPAPPVQAAAPVPEGPLFAVGVQVANRYRLDERIGRGGMAVVFRATDLQLGDAVAVKILTQALDGEEGDLRFKQELRLSRQLVHPNIVRLYDIGLHFGFPYITMELLSGSELATRMHGPMPLAEGLGYLIQACAGLQAAHDQGIVHRDVKPSNFFITSGGVVKVMDFGIAKVQNAPGLTATGVIAGTPAYMSPEQIHNFSGVSSATDLYALGVVAYEMFTGTLPFVHGESMAVLMMHANDPPPPPRRHNPAMPEALERAILKLMEKSPARRFASCGELARELEAIRAALPG